MPETKEYVAYTQLGKYDPGDVVDPNDFGDAQWAYFVEYDVVVPKNSPNDPNVLTEMLQAATTAASEAEGPSIPQEAVSAKVQEGMKAKAAAAESGSSPKEEPKAATTASKPTPKPPEPPPSPTVKKEG
jgi:hypothetical protein